MQMQSTGIWNSSCCCCGHCVNCCLAAARLTLISCLSSSETFEGSLEKGDFFPTCFLSNTRQLQSEVKCQCSCPFELNWLLLFNVDSRFCLSDHSVRQSFRRLAQQETVSSCISWTCMISSDPSVAQCFFIPVVSLHYLAVHLTHVIDGHLLKIASAQVGFSHRGMEWDRAAGVRDALLKSDWVCHPLAEFHLSPRRPSTCPVPTVTSYRTHSTTSSILISEACCWRHT